MKNISDETKEISEAKNFTTKLTAERWVHISLGKAVVWGALLFAGAFISGIGSSTLVKFNVASSLPGRVDAIEKELMVVQTEYMPLNLSLEKWKNNDEYHRIVVEKLDKLDAKIDAIRNLIK